MNTVFLHQSNKSAFITQVDKKVCLQVFFTSDNKSGTFYYLPNSFKEKLLTFKTVGRLLKFVKKHCFSDEQLLDIQKDYDITFECGCLSKSSSAYDEISSQPQSEQVTATCEADPSYTPCLPMPVTSEGIFL